MKMYRSVSIQNVIDAGVAFAGFAFLWRTKAGNVEGPMTIAEESLTFRQQNQLERV